MKYFQCSKWNVLNKPLQVSMRQCFACWDSQKHYKVNAFKNRRLCVKKHITTIPEERKEL